MLISVSFAALDLSQVEKAVFEYDVRISTVQEMIAQTEKMKSLLVQAVADQNRIILSLEKQLDIELE